MTESDKIVAFERKLQHLKEEESLILKLLKDVRKQMKKYEVEELQTCSETLMSKSDEEDSDSDDVVYTDKQLLQVLDCAELVNNRSLNLRLSGDLDYETNDDDEETETDESDELNT